MIMLATTTKKKCCGCSLNDWSIIKRFNYRVLVIFLADIFCLWLKLQLNIDGFYNSLKITLKAIQIVTSQKQQGYSKIMPFYL